MIDKKFPCTGADFLPLSAKSAKLLNLAQNSGLLVQRLVSRSPHEKMGLRGGIVEATIDGTTVLLGGDVILAINGIRFEMNDETLKKLSDFWKQPSICRCCCFGSSKGWYSSIT